VQPQTFDQYWLAYLAGHSKVATRLLHYVGLFFGPLIGVGLSFLVVWWAFFVIAPLSYVIALITHPLLEANSNKDFAGHPWWSVVSFFRMLWLELTGQLSGRLQRLQRGGGR
jgi:hypothetical protein